MQLFLTVALKILSIYLLKSMPTYTDSILIEHTHSIHRLDKNI